MDRLPLYRLKLLSFASFLFLFTDSSSLLAFEIEDVGIYAGAAGGYTHVVPDQGTSKNGYHLLLNGFADVSSSSWIWQLGGGFFYNRVYSDGERDFAGSQPDTIKQQTNLRIETRAGEAELAVRRPLGLGLELGIMLRSLFGASLSFSQEKDSKSAKYFIGPQLVLRLGRESLWMQRLDVNLGIDLNVSEKRVYLLTAGFAVGRNFAFPKEKREKNFQNPPPREDRYEEVLADKVINFATASSEVRGPALLFLQELGTFLKLNPDFWQEVTVEGHTDKKGKFDYNMQLSKDRAQAVRQVLVAQSADSSRIKSEGFGPTRPLMEGESPEALAANRRVVMIFHITGREQRNKLSAHIKLLRKKHFNE